MLRTLIGALLATPDALRHLIIICRVTVSVVTSIHGLDAILKKSHLESAAHHCLFAEVGEAHDVHSKFHFGRTIYTRMPNYQRIIHNKDRTCNNTQMQRKTEILRENSDIWTQTKRKYHRSSTVTQKLKCATKLNEWINEFGHIVKLHRLVFVQKHNSRALRQIIEQKL